MINAWHEVAAITAVLLTLLGVGLGVQWLYYWPKVQAIVKQAVMEAMGQEHTYVLREIDRVDRRHDVAILAINTKIAAVEVGIGTHIDYIRGRVDWIVGYLLEKEGDNGRSD